MLEDWLAKMAARFHALEQKLEELEERDVDVLRECLVTSSCTLTRLPREMAAQPTLDTLHKRALCWLNFIATAAVPGHYKQNEIDDPVVG